MRAGEGGSYGAVARFQELDLDSVRGGLDGGRRGVCVSFFFFFLFFSFLLGGFFSFPFNFKYTRY